MATGASTRTPAIGLSAGRDSDSTRLKHEGQKQSRNLTPTSGESRTGPLKDDLRCDRGTGRAHPLQGCWPSTHAEPARPMRPAAFSYTKIWKYAVDMRANSCSIERCSEQPRRSSSSSREREIRVLRPCSACARPTRRRKRESHASTFIRDDISIIDTDIITISISSI